jgi:hypothetical protein
MTISPDIARDALYIQCAVNPRAVARTLVEAIDEACDQDGSKGAGESAAVRLILTTLVELCAFDDGSLTKYGEATKECEKACGKTYEELMGV